MTIKKRVLGLLMLALPIMVGNVSYAQVEKNTHKTLSPYFLVKSDDPDVDRLPLKSTRAEVNVSGVIADVKVTQVYKNEGNRPLEAIYVFPASTRAAVYGMKMTIGERTITAKIRKREEARREYEQAKQAGKSASLLEQQRPNVFQMNVANILPSDVIKVELRYTELLVPSDAVYEFVYPTVVGTRYVGETTGQVGSNDRWTANPYFHQGESPPYEFSITANIATGLPIREIACPSHEIGIHYEGPALAIVNLNQSEKQGGNRDFILRYRLAGGKIETGLLLFEGDNENFFLLMLQPPKNVTKNQIPPREYIFIVDVSGSMHGYPLDISKQLLKDLISNLRPTDRFNVLLFAGGSHLMSERSLIATPGNIQRAINTIARQRGGGGTRLLLALKRALSLPKTEGYSRSVVIATDGYVSVEEEAFDLIRNNLGNANMFAFGIGSSVNRHLIEGMGRVGMGEPFIVTQPYEAPKQAKRFRKMIESPVLTNIKLDFGGFEVYDVEPPSIPDVFADRPVIVFGKWLGRPQGSISLRGITGERSFLRKVDVSRIEPLNTNSALRYLWARHRITILSDYNRLNRHDERAREVTNLGLSYNLLTAYTSFVAVDTRIRLQDGQAVTVKQPLPLPQGVSDYAVGRRSGPRQATSSLQVAPSGRDLMSTAVEESTKSKEVEPIVTAPEKRASGRERDEIALGKIFVTGGLSKKSIQSLLKKHLSDFNLCYRQTLKNGLSIKGKAVFKIVIDTTGRVLKVTLVTLKGTMDKGHEYVGFEKCMTQEFKRLRFSAPDGAKPVVVVVTLKFK